MRHASILLSLGCILLVAASGCDREGAPEEPESWDPNNAAQSNGPAVRVDENLLADQGKIVDRIRRQQERSETALSPSAPAPAATEAPAEPDTSATVEPDTSAPVRPPTTTTSPAESAPAGPGGPAALAIPSLPRKERTP